MTDEEKKKIDKAAEEFGWKTTHWRTKKLCPEYKNIVKEYLELATIQQKMDAPMKRGRG